MELSISARHFTLPDPLKAHIERKVESVLGSLPMKIISVRVVLDLEKVSRVQAEVVVNAKDATFQSSNVDHDAAIAFDMSLDKVEIQIRHALDKQKR